MFIGYARTNKFAGEAVKCPGYIVLADSGPSLRRLLTVALVSAHKMNACRHTIGQLAGCALSLLLLLLLRFGSQ